MTTNNNLKEMVRKLPNIDYIKDYKVNIVEFEYYDWYSENGVVDERKLSKLFYKVYELIEGYNQIREVLQSLHPDKEVENKTSR